MFSLLEKAEGKRNPSNRGIATAYTTEQLTALTLSRDNPSQHPTAAACSLPPQEPQGIMLGCSPCPAKPRAVLETYITDANIRRLQGEGSAAGKGEQTAGQTQGTARAHGQTPATAKHPARGREPQRDTCIVTQKPETGTLARETIK